MMNNEPVMQKTPKPPRLTPGLELYKRVKAAFIMKDTTFNAWCTANGIIRQNAKQALTGAWDGPKAQELRERILQASGLKK